MGQILIEKTCIRCSECIEVCPEHLMPAMLAGYAKAGLYDYCQKYHIDNCTNCGSCVKVCPAKIPLSKYINTAKREIAKETTINNAPEMTVVPEKKVKSEKRIKKLFPIIFICMLLIITSSLLMKTEKITLAVLESRQDPMTMALLQQIFPEAVLYSYKADTEIFTLYDRSRKKVGYAFYAQRGGYQSVITILIGLEDKETIKNIIITGQNETPGYFLRVINSEYFKQFIGLKIEDCFAEQDYYCGCVDTVSGATISSGAIANAVKNAALEKVQYLN